MDHADGVITLGWYIEDEPDDWSRKFLLFKGNDRTAVRHAGVASGCLLSKVDFQVDKKSIAIIPALHSSDVRNDMRSNLSKLAESIAGELGVQFQPNALTKKPHTSLRRIQGGFRERDSTVNGIYKSAIIPGVKLAIVVDDIVTRGSTLGDIARAVIERNKGTRVIGYALGKSERASFARQRSYALSNDHVPRCVLERWP